MKKKLSLEKPKKYNRKNDLAVNLSDFFSQKREQKRVAEFLLKSAIRISENGKLFYKDIEIPHTSVATVIGVDRRVIKSTAESIIESKELKEVFSKLESALILRDVAPLLGFGAIEIVPTDAAKKGIIAGVSKIIVKAGISIRQVISEDPMFLGAETTIITERPLPRKLIDKMLGIPGIKKVIVIS